MKSTLTISGVCNAVVYRWVLLAFYHESITRITHIEAKGDGLAIEVSGQQDSMYEAYRRIKDEIMHAEADLELRLTSY